MLAETNASPAAAAIWHYQAEFFPYLVKQVPDLLKSQDPKTGRFGTGIWIVTDQNVIYPLAVAWATPHADNPYYHKPELLEAIMAGGDALIEDQDANGMWVFRKKDGSTWGKIYMPWTYSRWIRAYGLIKDAMPAPRRARWEQALKLGFEGIAAHELKQVHNIPTHLAMALYCAGQVMARPAWCTQASAFMKQVVAAQDPGGFWSEHLGPVVNYNFVYVDAIGCYYGMSHDEAVRPALARAARFHANFTYPDGSEVETVDERNPYHQSLVMPNVGFSFSPEGRGYLHQQWQVVRARHRDLGADLAASFILYGEEGPEAPAPGALAHHHFVLGEADAGKSAVIHRDGPWFACLTSYHCPVPTSRWIQDRQNFVSLFHDRTGLIVGGGNTKLQPLWSTFTVGDTHLLSHRPGDENPQFTPPAGLFHVPTEARLHPDNLALDLTYGPTSCHVQVEILAPNKARLIYTVDAVPAAPMEAHVTLLPHVGKPWQTAAGPHGALGSDAWRLSATEAGAWFGHNGWRITVPAGASLAWPVLPHNPYTKDGHAEPAEGRIVLTLPFSKDVLRQEVVVEVL